MAVLSNKSVVGFLESCGLHPVWLLGWPGNETIHSSGWECLNSSHLLTWRVGGRGYTGSFLLHYRDEQGRWLYQPADQVRGPSLWPKVHQIIIVPTRRMLGDLTVEYHNACKGHKLYPSSVLGGRRTIYATKSLGYELCLGVLNGDTPIEVFADYLEDRS